MTKRVIVDHRERPSPWCLLPLDLNDLGELQVYLNVIHKGSVCVMTRSQCREEMSFENDNSARVTPLVIPESNAAGANNNVGCDDVIDDEDSRAEPTPLRSKEEVDESTGGTAELDTSADDAVELVEESSLESSGDDTGGEVGTGGSVAHNVEVGTDSSVSRVEGRVPGEGKDIGSNMESEEVGQFIEGLVPVKAGSDREKFREEVLCDESLKQWRELAERKERGFSWKRGLLVLSKFVCWDQFRDVLVVPKSFRKKVMGVAHEKGGHLGGEKTLRMIANYFTWPGMSKEVYGHCKSCSVCQMKSKYVPPKAPVVERPVLTEPFECLAIDLVGPLPKAKGGVQYVLTSVYGHKMA